MFSGISKFEDIASKRGLLGLNLAKINSAGNWLKIKAMIKIIFVLSAFPNRFLAQSGDQALCSGRKYWLDY